ncbi:DUF1934 domain-containing protein [Jeotgalibaca sp. MA1X17-3]|uniref:DUF1934 domain-containing protein n=1 Tax=Jeotgalibaca sp. MA1X17-3 TaxID=2908211 RepID=UPI001F27F1FF|nr:DUF1934 domain-containing protein [Jeotgalibaca sp. MA1X17-3]UJF15916.1 DUF1934 domain-containing protein [Jeotgalibaca sp. MA1X17-3]
MPIEKGTQIEYQMETIIKQEGEQEVFFYKGLGKAVQMGEWLYIRYEEEGTENKVTIKLSDAGKVIIIRRENNNLSSRMSFETTSNGVALLSTPAGMLEMETISHRLLQDYQDKPFGGTIQLDYSLSMKEQLFGNYSISLHFTT